MDSYLAWNDALAKRFFHPRIADQPVYFYVTEDVITEVGRTVGKGHRDFLSALLDGPQGVTRSGHCQRALQVAEGWRDQGFEYPPYIAYLALFVLAGGHEGDYVTQAYYPRLWSLLGEDRTDPLPSFQRMFELWDDLEQWSVRDRDGELGIFEVRIVGGNIHVGLPLAQMILTETERVALPQVFSDAELDPGRAVTSRELRRALVVSGRTYLRPMTLRTLERGSEAFQEALLDTVAEDFMGWDGSVPTPTGDGGSGRVFASLRLCLGVDRVAGTVQGTLRVFARGDYPDNPLRITGLAPEALECAEYYHGWSTPLRCPSSGREYVPDQGEWTSGLDGTDDKYGWRVRLESAQVRVFVEGQAAMLPGLIEVPQLPNDTPFYIAFNDTAAAVLDDWLEADCYGWKPLHIVAGLPSGWTLGSVVRALSDRGISNVRPKLRYTDRLYTRLVGGIRAAGGNTYFCFAPPRLAVQGCSHSASG